MERAKSSLPTEDCDRCLGTGVQPSFSGAELRTLRVNASLSQPELGKLVDLAPQYVSDVENGRRKLSPERAGRWLAACGVKSPWGQLDKAVTTDHD